MLKVSTLRTQAMLNEQHRMDVLTNNLANATTNGFKKEGTTSEAFDTVLAYKIKDLSEPGNLPRPMATNRAIDEAELNNPLNENYLERRVRKTGLNLGVKIGETMWTTPRARLRRRGIRWIWRSPTEASLR